MVLLQKCFDCSHGVDRKVKFKKKLQLTKARIKMSISVAENTSMSKIPKSLTVLQKL